MKRVTTAVTAVEKTMQERSAALDARLAEVGRMTAKQLYDYAQTEHGVTLKADNGRTWMLRKVSYMEQARIKGALTGRAAENAALLETPVKIAELKTEDKYHEKEACNMKTKSVTHIKTGVVADRVDKKSHAVKKQCVSGRSIDPAGKITQLSKVNPKREGTKAHEKFALYATHKTVQAYLNAGGNTAELKWDVARGFISVA